MKSVTTYSAKKFKDKDGYYHFPFTVMDDTPGGSNLGRIEVHIEPIKSKKEKGFYYIDKLLIWFTQTRDDKYVGKTFEIPCHTEMIRGELVPYRESFMSKVWRVGFCNDHGTVTLSAYPSNHNKELIINVGSSIMTDIDFK